MKEQLEMIMDYLHDTYWVLCDYQLNGNIDDFLDDQLDVTLVSENNKLLEQPSEMVKYMQYIKTLNDKIDIELDETKSEEEQVEQTKQRRRYFRVGSLATVLSSYYPEQFLNLDATEKMACIDALGPMPIPIMIDTVKLLFCSNILNGLPTDGFDSEEERQIGVKTYIQKELHSYMEMMREQEPELGKQR